MSLYSSTELSTKQPVKTTLKTDMCDSLIAGTQYLKTLTLAIISYGQMSKKIIIRIKHRVGNFQLEKDLIFVFPYNQLFQFAIENHLAIEFHTRKHGFWGIEYLRRNHGNAE